MRVYLDKLAHLQVVINCRYSIAQICTLEDIQVRLFTRAILGDVMSPNEFTTHVSEGFSVINC